MGPTLKVVGRMLVGRNPRSGARVAAWTSAAVLVLGAGGTACGGSDDPPPPGSTPTSASAAPGGGIDPQPSDSASASGPADVVAAKRQVEDNWAAFFNPRLTLDEKANVLENGVTMQPVLKAFNGDQRGGQTSARVTNVRFNSATQATVTYDLLLNEVPVLPNSKGTAVLQDSRWKVSVKTLCALVKLSGNAAAPGC
ncbi:hypothetical protein [Streptomyces sp. NPDC051561]|uniref:hypothetical protein n=1 Tax=Streptomyces sp. NPDC051561 TaxID=3365658 RepID=UPI0037A37E13